MGQLVASIGGLRCRLTNFVTVRAVVFIIVGGPNVRGLRDEEVKRSNAGLLCNDDEREDDELLDAMVTNVILTLRVVRAIVAPVIKVGGLQVVNCKDVTMVASKTSLCSVLLMNYFAIDLHRVDLASSGDACGDSADRTSSNSRVETSEAAKRSASNEARGKTSKASDMNSATDVYVTATRRRKETRRRGCRLFRGPVVWFYYGDAAVC